MSNLSLGATDKQVRRQVILAQLQATAKAVTSEEISQGKAAERLITFNAPYPIIEAEIARRVALLIGGKFIDREVIRQIADDDGIRTNIWNDYPDKIQRQLRADGDIMKHLVKFHHLKNETLKDEVARRQFRMALLTFGLGVGSQDDQYTITWGAGTNIVFPQAFRFYLGLDQKRLAKIFQTSFLTIEKANQDKERWYGKTFGQSRSDQRFYSAAINDFPQWIKTPEQLYDWLARAMYQLVRQFEPAK